MAVTHPTAKRRGMNFGPAIGADGVIVGDGKNWTERQMLVRSPAGDSACGAAFR